MIKLMVLDNIFIQMVLNISDNEKKINNMEKELKHDLMVLISKDIMLKEKRMDMENYSLQIVQFIEDLLRTIDINEKGIYKWSEVKFIMENQLEIKCTDLEKLYEVMESNMKENTKMIKNKVNFNNILGNGIFSWPDGRKYKGGWLNGR